DAIGRGRITITGRCDSHDVVIEVADSGTGIPPDVQQRLFEPFYTTKSEGVGTGLGLYLCRQMVDGMGGTLTFRTGPQGTTFVVRLPALMDEVDRADSAA